MRALAPRAFGGDGDGIGTMENWFGELSPSGWEVMTPTAPTR